MKKKRKNTEFMPTRYKYLPQENEIKFKIFRRDKYAFYLFTVIIGIEFQVHGQGPRLVVQSEF